MSPPKKKLTVKTYQASLYTEIEAGITISLYVSFYLWKIDMSENLDQENWSRAIV